MVTVILTHHLPINRPYLDLALKSVLQSVDVPIEVILVCDYDLKDIQHADNLTVIINPELNNATKKVHHAIPFAAKDSKYIMLMSDDVVVSRYLIREQCKILGTCNFILNPFSNADIGSRFYTNMFLSTKEGEQKSSVILRPDCCIEEFRHFEDRIFSCPGIVEICVATDWQPFYCTMFSKETWNKVGPLDEALEVRHNDEDWCYRAKKLSIQSMINLKAFAIHFGSRTLRATVTDAEKQVATDHFISKYKSGAYQ